MDEKTLEKVAYIALDPGETTGFALFADDGELIKYGQFTQKDQADWLKKHVTPKLKLIIVEDYKNYAWKRQKNWSRNQTSKNIGAVEMIANIVGIPIHLQMANAKGIGFKWAHLNEKVCMANHSQSHQYVAVAHGVYYLQLNGIRKPQVPED